MEQLGVMIRKWECNSDGISFNNLSKRNLNKQLKTLHKKLKKCFPIIIEYSIEKDRISNKYHSHLMIHYENNPNQIFEILMKFIGGDEWKIRNVGLDVFEECNGKYGFIHIQKVLNHKLYRSYINKYGELNTLF